MQRNDYIDTIVYNGHMINIGLDDYGQSYYLEYVNEDGQLVEVSCGTYNTDYMRTIEEYFGTPTMCDKYSSVSECNDIFTHGYCIHCPRTKLYHASRG